MKLYPIPGGDWAGTEVEWGKRMKAAGLDPKLFANTKSREVPTGKKELMEFLIFFGVDVYRLAAGVTTSAEPVDVEALRRLHNPDAAIDQIFTDAARDGMGGEFPDATAKAITGLPAPAPDLDRLFEAAPLGQKLRLAVEAIDAAGTELGLTR